MKYCSRAGGKAALLVGVMCSRTDRKALKNRQKNAKGRSPCVPDPVGNQLAGLETLCDHVHIRVPLISDFLLYTWWWLIRHEYLFLGLVPVRQLRGIPQGLGKAATDGAALRRQQLADDRPGHPALHAAHQTVRREILRLPSIFKRTLSQTIRPKLN